MKNNHTAPLSARMAPPLPAGKPRHALILLACLFMWSAALTVRAGDAVVIPQVTQGYGDPPPPVIPGNSPGYGQPSPYGQYPQNPPAMTGPGPGQPAYGGPGAPAPYPPSQPGGVIIPKVTEGYGAPPPTPGIGQGATPVQRPNPQQTPPRHDNRPAPPAGPHVSGPYRVGGVTLIDINTGRTLPIHEVDLRPTVERIQRGEKNAHRNDGTVYHNNNRQLPHQRSGYYHEYVVPTPGVHGPGPQRLIAGQRGEMYYTPDHYDTFIQVQ